jgi:hypothetical protein
MLFTKFNLEILAFFQVSCQVFCEGHLVSGQIIGSLIISAVQILIFSHIPLDPLVGSRRYCDVRHFYLIDQEIFLVLL